MTIAIITGASSGIGREFAIQLDKENSFDRFLLIGRDLLALEGLKSTLTKNATIISSDITANCSISKIVDIINNREVKYLINSAGFGRNGDFNELSLLEQLNMIDLNCRAVIELTHSVIPLMKSGASIINISSIAGFSPLGSFAIYGATKSFLNSFSVALRSELIPQNIKVLTVTPGSVDTNFQKRSRGDSDIKKKMFSKKSSAEMVVKRALKDLDKNRTFSTYGSTSTLARLLRKYISPLALSRLAYYKIYSKK